MIFKTQYIRWHLKEGVSLKTDSAQLSDAMSDPAANESAVSEQGALTEFSGDEISPSAPAEPLSSEIKPLCDLNSSLEPDNIRPLPYEQNIEHTVSLQNEPCVNRILSSDNICGNTQSEDATASAYRENTVDGTAVSSEVLAKASEDTASPSLNTWMKLPYRLRSKRADIFIDRHSGADFVDSLSSFLESKGLCVAEYDDSVCYLPSDVLLLGKERLVFQGCVIRLDDGKRAVYNSLVAKFPGRIK